NTSVPVTAAPPVMLIPRNPVSTPENLRLRSRTDFLVSVPAKLSKAIETPLVAVLVVPAKTSWQSIWIDLVMVTVPKDPGSRQLISPFTLVLEIAPANVLQGAVRLHGNVSSPTPDTHVLLCA